MKRKTALVIGGTGDIGTGLVHEFVQKGWDVAVMSRHSALRADISGKHVTLYQGDATNEGDMGRVARGFAEKYGHADCLVYAAGLPPDVSISLAEYPMERWNATFDTYVKGFLISFRTMLTQINRGGHVVALGSAITRFPSDALPPINAGPYAAAKAALSELVKWVRREAKERGVLVSIVSPGAVDTSSHHTGDLAAIPKRMLSLDTVCDTIITLVLAGADGELQVVA